jgi:transcriptional regulator with XRE-family HTH domain
MRDEFHIQLRARREERAMSAEHVAALVSLSFNEYFDLEHDTSEWRMVTPLFKIKFLVRLLDIDILSLVGPLSDDVIAHPYDIAAFIKSRRSQLGMSPVEFADKAGFFPTFADIVEGHPLGLELFPVDVAIFVAQALDVPHTAFLRWIFEENSA